MGLEVFGDRRDPLGLCGRQFALSYRARDTQPSAQGSHQRSDFSGSPRQPVIGKGTGVGRRALNGVQP